MVGLEKQASDLLGEWTSDSILLALLEKCNNILGRYPNCNNLLRRAQALKRLS